MPPLRHEFPQWHPQDLSRIFPTLEPEGVDLLKRMIEYDPAKRISVRSITLLGPHAVRAGIAMHASEHLVGQVLGEFCGLSNALLFCVGV